MEEGSWSPRLPERTLCVFSQQPPGTPMMHAWGRAPAAGVSGLPRVLRGWGVWTAPGFLGMSICCFGIKKTTVNILEGK